MAFSVDHLLTALDEFDRSSKKDGYEAFLRFAKRFYESYAAVENLPSYKLSMDKDDVKKVHKHLPREENARKERCRIFDLEYRSIVLRTVVEQLANLEDGDEGYSLVPYYGSNLFRCPKPWCDFYAEGFPTEDERDKHLDRHELPFFCTVQDCFGMRIGFESESTLSQHNKKYHSDGEEEVPAFPRPKKQTKDNIWWAAAQGDIDTLARLLPNYNLVNKRLNGKSPLYLAILNGHLPAAQLLMDNRAKITPPTRATSVETAFHAAVLNGDPSVLRFLIDRARNMYDANIIGRGKTPLMVAAEKGNLAVVDMLLHSREITLEPDEELDNGGWLTLVSDSWTPNNLPSALSLAAGNGHLSVVKRLVDHDHKQVDRKDSLERKPLSYAAQNGREDVVRYLLGIRNTHNGDYENEEEILSEDEKYSVDEKVDGDKNDRDEEDSAGRTPLIYAVMNGHDAITRLLLAARFLDVDIQDDDGRTALSYAAEFGTEISVKLLVGGGKADVHLPDWEGRTPLSYAARNGREAAVRVLAKMKRVKIDYEDLNGRTALSYAAENGHEAVVRGLIETEEVKVDSRDLLKRTPLSYAAQEGREAVVRILLETGQANMYAKDHKGKTPWRRAKKAGHEGVLAIMRPYRKSAT